MLLGEKQVGRAVGQKRTPQSGLGAAEVTFLREDNSNNNYTKSPTLFTALFYCMHWTDTLNGYGYARSAYQFRGLLACFGQSRSIVSGLYPDFSGNKEQVNGAEELYFQHFIAGILSLPLCMLFTHLVEW